MRQSPRGKCDTMPSSGAPSTGATTAIRLFTELTAPIVCPWLVASAALEIKLWIDAATVKPSRLHTITAYIIQPCVAAPYNAYAIVDETRPSTASRRALKCLSRRPSNRPCTITDVTPTTASDQPFSSGPQPNLNVV